MAPFGIGKSADSGSAASAPGVSGNPGRHEPPPLDRRPSGSILKRSPSGNHLENGLPLPDGAHPADPYGSHHSSHHGRSERGSQEGGGGMVGAFSRLTYGVGSEGGSVNKRMSFSDQHGMDLSVVHEVQDTHYKRTCLQKNAGLITVALCIIVTIVCAVAIAVIFTSRPEEEGEGER